MLNSVYCNTKLRFVQLTRIGQIFVVYNFWVAIFTESAFAQVVDYQQFPMPLQIYQRDASNKALVEIKGQFHSHDYSDVSVIVKIDKKQYFRQKQKLSFQAGQSTAASFSFQPSITAGLVEYDFFLYAHKANRDSFLLKEAKQVLCGDNIIIYGQSNAQANNSYELDQFLDEFRFGRAIIANFETNDYSWQPSIKWTHYFSGLIGLEIQRQLINTYKIPIGIMNGAVGNMSIDELMERNENNHEDTHYNYGKLLTKANKVNLGKTARMLIWRQGESEAFEAYRAGLYPGKFARLRSQLLEDFPALKKIYVYQNNILWAENDKAGDLRDFQRSVGKLYPDCVAISTVGTPGYEGLHFSYEGYMQNGRDVARLMARDFMNNTDTLEIRSPNIQKAYFNDDRTSLVLEFEKDQQMHFPENSIRKNDNTQAYVKDYIYLDGQAGKIVSGKSEGNRIILKLSEKSSATKVTYGPDYFRLYYESVEGIPYFRNSRGVNALTFKNFPIEVSSKPLLVSTLIDDNQAYISLGWFNLKSQNYSLEKAVNLPLNFVKIAAFAGGEENYNDYKVKKGVKYYYRLNLGNSGYTNTVEVTIPLQAATATIFEDVFLVYPNPVIGGATINIDIKTQLQEVILTDNLGKFVQSLPVEKGSHSIPTAQLKSGIYILEAIDINRNKITKRIIVD